MRDAVHFHAVALAPSWGINRYFRWQRTNWAHSTTFSVTRTVKTDANGYHRLEDVPGSERESSEWHYIPDYDDDGYND